MKETYRERDRRLRREEWLAALAAVDAEKGNDDE